MRGSSAAVHARCHHGYGIGANWSTGISRSPAASSCAATTATATTTNANAKNSKNETDGQNAQSISARNANQKYCRERHT
jgi:hypothetical protein